MKNRRPFTPLAFLKQVSKEIKTTDKELEEKKTDFDKEWNKWGKQKTNPS